MVTLQHFNEMKCSPYPIISRLIWETRADMTPWEVARLLSQLDLKAIEAGHPGILRELWLLDAIESFGT